jgi:hypothetical protein
MRCWSLQSLVHACQAVTECAPQSGATQLPRTPRRQMQMLQVGLPPYQSPARQARPCHVSKLSQLLPSQEEWRFLLCQHQQVHVSLAVHHTCQDSCQSTSSHLCCHIQHHTCHWQAKHDGWAQGTGRVDHTAGVGASCGSNTAAAAAVTAATAQA